MPGEADKELIPIFIFLFHFFLFPTSEVQVRFELPAALSLHLPNFRLSCRPQGLSGYQARNIKYSVFLLKILFVSKKQEVPAHLGSSVSHFSLGTC